MLPSKTAVEGGTMADRIDSYAARLADASLGMFPECGSILLLTLG